MCVWRCIYSAAAKAGSIKFWLVFFVDLDKKRALRTPGHWEHSTPTVALEMVDSILLLL